MQKTSPPTRTDNALLLWLLRIKTFLCAYLAPIINLIYRNDRRHDMASLNGTVTAAGKPQPDATVTALAAGTANILGETKTGGDGGYTIDSLSPGASVDVVVAVGGAERARQNTTVGRTTTRLDFDISSTGVSSATTATTATTATSTTETGGSESSVTSGTSATSTGTSATTVSTATSATTATSVTALDETAFNALRDLIAGNDFAAEAPVNIPEAKEARRVFTVGVYMLAKVPESISRLNEILVKNRTGNGNGNNANIININTLLANNDQKIQNILRLRGEEFNDEGDMLDEVRREFDLGTGSAASVNSEFKRLYREFVTLCADNLLGIDPQRFDDASRVVVDFKEKEEVIDFLKQIKHAVQWLVQNLSVWGTLGTQSLVTKWSNILVESLGVLNNVAANNVASDDADQKTANVLLATLTNTPTTDVKAYVTHGRDGGVMLDNAIQIYEVIQTGGNLENEDDGYLRDLFYEPGFVFKNPDRSVSSVLKQKASTVRVYPLN